VGDKRGRDAFSFIRSFANQDKIGWLVARAQSSGCQLRNNFLRHFGQHRWSPPPRSRPGGAMTRSRCCSSSWRTRGWCKLLMRWKRKQGRYRRRTSANAIANAIFPRLFPRLIQVLVVTFTTSDPPPTLPYHKRSLGGSARVLGAELGYLRRLVLDGDWRGAEAFAVGDDENDDEDGDENEFQKKRHPSVDANAIKAHCRTQAFLETLDGGVSLDGSSGSGRDSTEVDPDAIVEHLTLLRDCLPIHDANASKRFETLCAVLQLDDLREFPPLADWTPKRGRLLTFAALAEELESIYPDGGVYARRCQHNADLCNLEGVASCSARRIGELEGLMRHRNDDARSSREGKQAHDVSTSGKENMWDNRSTEHVASGKPKGRVRDLLRASFAASASWAKLKTDSETNGDEQDKKEKVASRIGDTSQMNGILETSGVMSHGSDESGNVRLGSHASFASSPKRVGSQTRITSSQQIHEDLMGAFDETELGTGLGVDNDSDWNSNNNSYPKFVHAGDLFVAETGVRCLVRAPNFPGDDDTDACFGLGTFAVGTSGRSLHVTRGVGSHNQNTRKNVHPPPCSIYAVAWSGVGGTHPGGGVIATGANDGSVAMTPTKRTFESSPYDDSGYTSTQLGTPSVTPGAVGKGAVRAVAFVSGSDGGAGYDDGSAADVSVFAAAGGGDFSITCWSLDESGVVFAPGPRVSLRGHTDSIVALVTDPETRWLLTSASKCGEVFVWDLRDRTILLGANPSLRLDVANACGDGVGLASAAVRGGKLACGFANGGIAAVDARLGFNSLAFSKGHGLNSLRVQPHVVWSDIVHSGECRSVDIAPLRSATCAAFHSSFTILSGGFDGSLTIIDASVGVGGGDFGKEHGFGRANSNVVWQRSHAHADKVVAARFGVHGNGFVSSGTDRVVKAWTLETPKSFEGL